MICQDRNQEGGIFYTGKGKNEFPALQDFFFPSFSACRVDA